MDAIWGKPAQRADGPSIMLSARAGTRTARGLALEALRALHWHLIFYQSLQI